MTFVQDLLDALAPMLYDDSTALTTYLTGLATPFELVENWVSDTDDDVGWSLLLDVDSCPEEALPWLAQIVGIKLNTGLSVADQRQQIESLANWKRGSLPAIKAAPAPYLTGTKTVIIRERYDGTANDAPYYIYAATYAGETPNATVAEAAIRAQKATGLILTYENLASQTLQNIKDNYATLQDMKNAYATLQGIRANLVGT